MADAEEIYILDLSGRIQLSTLAQDEGKSQASQPFFVGGSSQTTVQNVYVSGLTNQPTMTVATPLFDQNGAGQRVAVLAANLSLARLDQIVQQRTGLGQTGRTYLVGPDRRQIQSTTAGGTSGVLDSAAIENAVVDRRDGAGPVRRRSGRAGDRRLYLDGRSRGSPARRDEPGRGVRTRPRAGPHDRSRRPPGGNPPRRRRVGRGPPGHPADPVPRCRPPAG